jgi:hypothetical protein
MWGITDAEFAEEIRDIHMVFAYIIGCAIAQAETSVQFRDRRACG